MNLSPMLTPPNTAVDTEFARWHMTYLACVGIFLGVNVTVSGKLFSISTSSDARVAVPSHHLVNDDTAEQSRDASTRTPRLAALRMASRTRSVDSPGSKTYTLNSTLSPLPVLLISSTMVDTVWS